tara:strand:- start:41 stop:937 length:897 start_codon:yes stop_codon:yes gene_type:complete
MFKTALVTGGAGFIGSTLVNRLISMGVAVTIVDNLSTGKKENINPKAKFILEDICNINSNTLKNIDMVFHTAALARVQPSIIDPVNFDRINVGGTVNLLKACVDAKVKRVIYSASSSCYGNTTILPTPETAPTNPLSPYGLQKYIGEQYCKMFSEVYDIDTCSLRYFNVYGDNMSLEGAYKLAIPIFAQQIKNNEPCTINNMGDQRRDFTFVEDVVDANILAANSTNNLNGESFNIGNGDNISVNRLVDLMGGKKQYGNKVIEPFETLADNSKAKEVLKWDPKGNLKQWLKGYLEKIL